MDVFAVGLVKERVYVRLLARWFIRTLLDLRVSRDGNVPDVKKSMRLGYRAVIVNAL